ncbi:exocyst complex component EXO70A1-like [Cajanus cajan]|uniref:exocyst complex component EXO70A1-like n=1 Tax=Cajanus cajan TaxID=3821 RepID=UPI00098D7F38|nr:exocyst complex component EXO70A1-like [Cajanus cajan]
MQESENLFVIWNRREKMQWHYHRIRLSKIETLLKGKACSGIKEAATSLTNHLAQRAHETFEEFEVAIEKESTKTAVTYGTVHPLKHSVINYVWYFLSKFSVWVNSVLSDPNFIVISSNIFCRVH